MHVKESVTLGQPSESNAHGCVGVSSRDGSWSAKPCSLVKTYVCRMVTGRSTTPTSTSAPTTAVDGTCPFGFTFSEVTGKCYLLVILNYDICLECSYSINALVLGRTATVVAESQERASQICTTKMNGSGYEVCYALLYSER